MDVCAVANWSTRAELAVAHYYPSASSALKSLKFKFSMGLKIIYMAMGASGHQFDGMGASVGKQKKTT